MSLKNKKNVEVCPWCKKKPDISEHYTYRSWDSLGNMYGDIRTIPEVEIKCNTLRDCPVRPRLTRCHFNENLLEETIDIWNSYSKEDKDDRE